MTESRAILLIGCCGMGVGPLGIFLAGMGHRVYGYDDYPISSVMDRLEASGIRKLDHLHGTTAFDEVILTRAVQYSPDRLEQLRKRFSGAKIYFRGEYLANLAKSMQTVVVAGTHGKTSTTAHLVALLQQANYPCSYILGGFFAEDTLPAACFREDCKCLVVELDESDGTIDAVEPWATVLTNVELDHVDHYATESMLKHAFLSLLARTRTASFVSHRACQTLDLAEATLSSLLQVQPALEEAPLFSENVQLAEAVARWLGVPETKTENSLACAVERRQEMTQLGNGTWIVTDYAHHPGELEALRQWCETRFPGGRFHWVFQPHRYSRTVALKSAFVDTLQPLDPIVLPAYAAFESRIPGGSAGDLQAALLAKGARSTHPHTPEQCLQELCQRRTSTALAPGQPEVILFVGAGDIPLWRDWYVKGVEFPDLTPDQRWLKFFEKRPGMQGTRATLAEPLRRKTTLNVGGAARCYMEPASVESLQLAVKLAALLGLPVRVLGKGSNLLIRDEGIDALVLRLSQPCWCDWEQLSEGQFRVGAGLACKRMSRLALEAGIEGFNFLDGIPGSLGGALWMNAGAMGREMADVVVEVECMDLHGRRLRIPRSEMDFSYRSCANVKDLIVMHLIVQGKKVDATVLEQDLQRLRQQRQRSQPSEPSAGCMFKNPSGDSAGRLIDAAGLKGFRIGGASISRKHANFLITDRATHANDVQAVIDHAKNEVNRQFGVELEQEIQCFNRITSSNPVRENGKLTPTLP